MCVYIVILLSSMVAAQLVHLVLLMMAVIVGTGKNEGQDDTRGLEL